MRSTTNGSLIPFPLPNKVEQGIEIKGKSWGEIFEKAKKRFEKTNIDAFTCKHAKRVGGVYTCYVYH